MGLIEAMEQLPKLLEVIGIDAVQAKLAALQPALERAWAVVGLDQQAPVLTRVQKSLRALAKAPDEAVAEKFTEVCIVDDLP